MAKMYNLIGTVRGKDGVLTVRGSATEYRVKALVAAGMTDIVMAELPVEMCKLHGAKFIRDVQEFQSPEQQEAINKYISLNDDGTMVVLEYETPEVVDNSSSTTELETA